MSLLVQTQISVRSGSGLGDSLYLQAIVRHLAAKGQSVEALSDWPDVFLPLKGKVKVSPFRRNPGPIRAAHYAARRYIPATTQFQDVCIGAGLGNEPVELKLDWQPTAPGLVAELRARAAGLPIIAVMLPREPMGRVDGYAKELLPNGTAIQYVIDRLDGKALFVQVGKGGALHNFRGVVDFANRTTVAQMIDIVWAAQATLGYVSFFVPLSESLDKPALFVWAHRGLISKNPLIRTITPQKILCGPKDLWVMDNADQVDIRAKADELIDAART